MSQSNEDYEVVITQSGTPHLSEDGEKSFCGVPTTYAGGHHDELLDIVIAPLSEQLQEYESIESMDVCKHCTNIYETRT